MLRIQPERRSSAIDNANLKVMSEEQALGPATPEDVAILYSWANLPGAKYRDFSASRREYRAQQRARIAEQQREAALSAAHEMEEAANRDVYDAQRKVEEAHRLEQEAVADAEAQAHAEDALRRAQERAELERQEAHRHEQSAESLRQRADAARQEMMEARKRAEEQAARYAEFDALYRAQVEDAPADALPGELADPYYYTGQVDPAYFASTPGVRTAQAMRTSTERKAYIYPAHPGSQEFDSGSLQAYRPNTNFAPSPAQEQRPFAVSLEHDRRSASEPPVRHDRRRPAIQYDPVNDHYYDGGSSGRMFIPRQNAQGGGENANPRDRDLHIRPSTQRASLEDFTVAEEIAPTFAPTPRYRPAPQTIFAEPAQRDRRSAPALPPRDALAPHIPHTSNPVLADRRRPSPDLVVAPLPPQVSEEEAYSRSVDRRSDGGRRRHDTPLDNRARTARHPRTSETEAVARPPEEEYRETVVPPSWLSSADWPDAESTLSPAVSTVETLFDPAPPRVAIPPYRPISPPLRDIARDTTPGNARLPEPASPALRQSALPPQALRTPSPQRNSEITLGNDSSFASERSPLGLENRLDTLRTQKGAPSLTSQMTDPVAGIRRERLRPVPEEAVQLSGNPIEPSVENEDLPRPDTLQQSRERVASRWFALKGLVGSQSSDRAEVARSADPQTPALTVLSLSGGVGKTSIVATLGRTLSSLGEKVMLADTNTHGLLPYYFGARDLRPGSVRTFTPPPGSADAPVLLVNYEIEGLSADETAQDHLMEDVHRRAKTTQRVLVDLSTSGLWMARRLAIHSPWILVPVAPDMNSVLGTHTVERLFNDVTDLEGRPVKPFYVLNQFDRALPLHLDVREVLRQSLGDRLLPIMIHRAPAVSEALAEGMTVIDYAPGSPVTEDYMNLANWIRHLAAPGSHASRGVRWSER